jgi:hypothetical protein
MTAGLLVLATVAVTLGLVVLCAAVLLADALDGPDDGDDVMAIADAIQDGGIPHECTDPNTHVLTGCIRCFAFLDALTRVVGRTNYNLEFVRITSGIAS